MLTYLLVKLKGKEFIEFIYISLLIITLLIFKFGFLYGLFLYLFLYIDYFIYSIFKIRKNNYFRTYFGVPGSGKSTLATYYAREIFKQNKKYIKKNKNKKIKKVYACNISIDGAYSINKSDINIKNLDLHDCLLIIDEAGLSYNNRNFSKNFNEDELKLYKYHRKRNIDIIILSQSYEDMDKKLRDLSSELYFLKKSMIPFFIKSIKIKKFIMIDKDTKQIIEGYKKELFSGFYIYMPKTWKFFDTKEEQ